MLSRIDHILSKWLWAIGRILPFSLCEIERNYKVFEEWHDLTKQGDSGCCVGKDGEGKTGRSRGGY